MDSINGYELSRNFWDWSFSNPEKVKPIHSAIYFFAVEHCNRLGWKDKFGFPSQMVMEAIGVKNWRTYSSGLSDLVDFGFIKMVETSRNQYSSNIIAIVNFTKANTKALDKALSKHSTKHSQGTVSIDKQYNKEQITNNLLSEIKISDVEDNLKPYFTIAVNFQKLFIKNLKEKDASTVHQEKATFKNYVNPIRLMVENKECTIENLREVYQFLDSSKGEFWKTNILSTSKLREKITTLVMNAKAKDSKFKEDKL